MTNAKQEFLRASARIISVLGILIYVAFLYLWYVEWHQNANIHQSTTAEILFFFSDVILASGLPPLLLAIYFLLLGKTVRDWSIGMIAVLVAVPVHFVVTVFAAHSNVEVYLPMQLAELAGVLILIWYWHKRMRT